MATLRSYLVGGTYEWIVAHDMTPYLLVDALVDGVNVPDTHIKNGRILLNASPGAARSIEIKAQGIEFDVTFSGTPWHIVIPIESIMALYSRETNQGIFAQYNPDEPGLLVNEGEKNQLDPAPRAEPEPATKTARDTQQKAKKMGFKVIK